MECKIQNDSLTDSDYWEERWRKLKLPSRIDIRRYEHWCNHQIFQRKLPKRPLRLLEVGCAPGRYLIYFSENFGYAVNGVELTPTGCAITRRNLALAGVKGQIFEGDFLNIHFPLEDYDVVFSAGFIEHFVNPIFVLEKMYTVLKPGGILLATLPNFAGSLGALRKRFDGDVYLKHNPITAKSLRSMYTQLNIQDIYVEYFGSLRLSVLVHTSSPLRRKLLWLFSRLADLTLVALYRSSGISLEGSWLSSNIVACGVKQQRVS